MAKKSGRSAEGEGRPVMQIIMPWGGGGSYLLIKACAASACSVAWRKFRCLHKPEICRIFIHWAVPRLNWIAMILALIEMTYRKLPQLVWCKLRCSVMWSQLDACFSLSGICPAGTPSLRWTKTTALCYNKAEMPLMGHSLVDTYLLLNSASDNNPLNSESIATKVAVFNSSLMFDKHSVKFFLVTLHILLQFVQWLAGIELVWVIEDTQE